MTDETGTESGTDEHGEALSPPLVEGKTVHENGTVTTVFRNARGELMISYEMPIPVMRGVVIKSEN